MKDLNPSSEVFSRLCLKNYRGYRLYYAEGISTMERKIFMSELDKLIVENTPPIERIELHQEGLLIIVYSHCTKAYRIYG